MTTIRTTKDLEKFLERMAREVLDDVSKVAVDMAKERVVEDVYEKYKPTEGGYQRTGVLRSSLTTIERDMKKGEYVVTVGHNRSLLHRNYNSVVNQDSSVSLHIPEIVHEGKVGAILHRGYWKNAPWYIPHKHTFAESRAYMSNTKKELEDGKYKALFMAKLKDRGIRAE